LASYEDGEELIKLADVTNADDYPEGIILLIGGQFMEIGMSAPPVGLNLS
jgi:hypothetical protein